MPRKPKPLRRYSVRCNFTTVTVEARDEREARKLAKKAHWDIAWGMKHGMRVWIREVGR